MCRVQAHRLSGADFQPAQESTPPLGGSRSMRTVPFADYYAILGVDPGADGSAIKSAYRRLARRYHPDVAKGEHAARRFLLIQEAYEVWSDEEARRKYDVAISKPRRLSRFSGKRGATSRGRTVSPSEPAASRRVFRLTVSGLVLRLGVLIDIE